MQLVMPHETLRQKLSTISRNIFRVSQPRSKACVTATRYCSTSRREDKTPSSTLDFVTRRMSAVVDVGGRTSVRGAKNCSIIVSWNCRSCLAAANPPRQPVFCEKRPSPDNVQRNSLSPLMSVCPLESRPFQRNPVKLTREPKIEHFKHFGALQALGERWGGLSVDGEVDRRWGLRA